MNKIFLFVKFNSRKIVLGALAILFIFSTPQIVLAIISNSKIYGTTSFPQNDYGIVFGAVVYNKGELSPIAKQRVDSAVLAYKSSKINKLYISGTNSANHEVEQMTNYATAAGVERSDIITDYYGIDTADTCRHFSAISKEAVLFTQEFHLPRAMFICGRHGINTSGAAVNKISPAEPSDISTVEVYATRIKRAARESTLTWAYILGIYNKISNDAPELVACNVNQSEADAYSDQVTKESINYKVEEQEFKRQATDGSRRKIYIDKNNEVVLIEDAHSGESGTRVVSVVLKAMKVIKIFDISTQYQISPIEDPNSKPTITKDVFYLSNNQLCSWYKQGIIMDLSAPEKQEYLNGIKSISNNAEETARTTRE